MRRTGLVFLAIVALAAGRSDALAESIGFAGPLSGPFAALGAQMKAGVEAAGAVFDVKDDSCTAEGGKAAAEHFAGAGVRIVVGFLCTEAIEAALPVLSGAGIPVITPAVRAVHLADNHARSGHLLFRLAPRADAEAAAAARLLRARWGDAPFAIVDDGAPMSRALAETVRLSMEQAGTKPVLVDGFRPAQPNQIGLLRRLAKAGATRAFVAGDRSDIAIMARDQQERADAETIEFAGGESLRAAPDDVSMPDGVVMVAPPNWAEAGDPVAVAAIRALGSEPDGYALPAFAATQVAQAALADADAGANLATVLGSTVFSTAIGPASFDEKGDWREDSWKVFISENQHFIMVN